MNEVLINQENIGRVIREARTRKGLSQPELARRVGVTQPDISDIERGERNNLTLKMLDRLARALDMEVLVRLPESDR